MWLTVPESEKPEQFSSALLWAKQMGESARLGYEAIFKQPGLRELSADTPVSFQNFFAKNVPDKRILGGSTKYVTFSPVTLTSFLGVLGFLNLQNANGTKRIGSKIHSFFSIRIQHKRQYICTLH